MMSDDPVKSGAREVPSPAERIELIADMMERLEWQRDKSAKKLAKEWGLSVDTVQGNAAEASRRVVADADDCRRDITAGCRKLFRSAVDADDAKGARQIGELWASVSGAKAAEKHEHKVAGVELSDLDKMKKAAEANECSPENSDSEPNS
jgi:hypothetical protein